MTALQPVRGTRDLIGELGVILIRSRKLAERARDQPSGAGNCVILTLCQGVLFRGERSSTLYGIIGWAPDSIEVGAPLFLINSG